MAYPNLYKPAQKGSEFRVQSLSSQLHAGRCDFKTCSNREGLAFVGRATGSGGGGGPVGGHKRVPAANICVGVDHYLLPVVLARLVRDNVPKRYCPYM